jgi:hypothetical protein
LTIPSTGDVHAVDVENYALECRLTAANLPLNTDAGRSMQRMPVGARGI